MRIAAPVLFTLAACGGGSATSGALPPVDEAGVPIVDSGAPAAAVALATFDGFAVGIVVDGDTLYLGVGLAPKGRIARVPASGGELTELATDSFMGSSIAVDDRYVYWGNRAGHQVRRVPKTGGAAEAIVELAEARPVYVSVDDRNVYVQTENVDSVLALKKDGTDGPLFSGSAGVMPCGIATDATTLYICSSSGVYAAPKEGGARVDVYRGAVGGEKRVMGFAVDGTSTFVSINVDACLRNSVLWVATPGGTAQEIAASCGTNHMVGRDGVLYWTAENRGLSSIPTTGGKPRTHDELAVGPLAVDATYVYFTRRDEALAKSTLFRAPR